MSAYYKCKKLNDWITLTTSEALFANQFDYCYTNRNHCWNEEDYVHQRQDMKTIEYFKSRRAAIEVYLA